MIKNIIFDLGGVLFDEGLDVVSKVLNEDAKDIYNKTYNKIFRECILGHMEVSDYIKMLDKNDPDYEKMKFILQKENQPLFLPIIKENYDYISKLKDKYNLYILSNLTKESYEYVQSVVNLDDVFIGGVYSFKVGYRKPDKEIYEIILDKYHLNKEETIFFDDKERNVKAARELGIKAVVFKSIKDIEDNIN